MRTLLGEHLYLENGLDSGKAVEHIFVEDCPRIPNSPLLRVISLWYESTGSNKKLLSDFFLTLLFI